MKIKFSEQFHIQEREYFRYIQDGEALKGWDRNHIVYGYGLISRQDILDTRVEAEKVLVYQVCDQYGIPVGQRFNKPYAFLLKSGVQFPNLKNNQFYDIVEAFDCLTKIDSYFRKLQSVKKKKTEQKMINTQQEEIWMTKQLESWKNSSDTLKRKSDGMREEKRKKTMKEDFFLA